MKLYQPHKKIAIFFIVLTCLLVALGFTSRISSSYGATIAITALSEETSKNFDLPFAANPSDAETILADQIVEETIVREKTFTPKATITIEDKAEGEVILINDYSRSQTLVATTRLLSEDNVLFHLSKQITIPANSQITASVYADQIGKESEIGPSKFTIPGLPSFLQSKIYAKSTEPMKSGLKKIGVVTQTDIDQAKEELKKELTQETIQKLEGQIKSKNQKAVYQEILEEECDAKPDEEKAEFQVKIKLKVALAALNQEELYRLAGKHLEEILAPELSLISLDKAGFQYQLKDYNLEKGVGNISVKLSGRVMLSQSHPSLNKSQLVLLSAKEIKEKLLAGELKDKITRVQVKFSPFWIKKAPAEAGKIKIKIIKAS